MQNPSFDPGLTNQFAAPLRRAINRDGTFNVRRSGVSWRDVHPYLYLINASWPHFFGFVFTSYLFMNLLFACLYWFVGPEELQGAEAPTAFGVFLNTFFFSAQTLTTVGYGGIHPRGLGANIVAAVESMFGVLGFAIGTGLLFGRFSKPSARIGFSNKAVIAPYQDTSALQFRVTNRRPNLVMDVEARVMLMTVDRTGDRMKRNYEPLNLERAGIFFFPVTWTVVHPIDKESPLHGKTPEDLERAQAEILVLLRGFDDTFSQTIHARFSYRYDEIEWGARFAPAFDIDPEGTIDVFVDRISETTPAPISRNPVQ